MIFEVRALKSDVFGPLAVLLDVSDGFSRIPIFLFLMNFKISTNQMLLPEIRGAYLHNNWFLFCSDLFGNLEHYYEDFGVFREVVVDRGTHFEWRGSGGGGV